MATKKPGSTAKKPTQKRSTSAAATVTKRTTATRTKVQANDVSAKMPGIIIAEIVGTFILTLVALLSLQTLSPLYVGLTLLVLVIAIGSISGAHVNPAVTFGLWAARKLQGVLVPVYWIAQFIGAILAVLLLNIVGGGNYGLDFSGFSNFNWGIVSVELVGTAVFLFGVVAVVSQKTLSTAAKGLGVGMSLAIGVLVSTSLFTVLQTNAQANLDTTEINLNDRSTFPHELVVKGATLNPAVALAATESTTAELTGSAATADKEKGISRLSLEVILGTLIGAALGGNLYLLAAYAQRRES